MFGASLELGVWILELMNYDCLRPSHVSTRHQPPHFPRSCRLRIGRHCTRVVARSETDRQRERCSSATRLERDCRSAPFSSSSETNHPSLHGGGSVAFGELRLQARAKEA